MLMVIAELSTLPLMNLCTLLRPASKHKSPGTCRGSYLSFSQLCPLPLETLNLPLLLRQLEDSVSTAIPLLLYLLQLPVALCTSLIPAPAHPFRSGPLTGIGYIEGSFGGIRDVRYS